MKARKAGVDRTVILKLIGLNKLSMFLRYSTVDERDGKSAVEKFRACLGPEPTTSKSTSRQKRASAKIAEAPSEKAPRAEVEPAT